MSRRAELVTDERAGFVSRLCAFLADALILSILLAAASWLAQVAARSFGRFSPPVDPSAAVLLLGSPVAFAVYHAAFWRVSGQTPGKWLVGVKVIRRDGGPLTIMRALLRVAGYALSALPLYLGFLWIIGPRRLGWHDRIAATEVRYVRAAPVPDSEATRLRRRLVAAARSP